MLYSYNIRSIQPGVQAGVASLIPAGNTAAVGQNPFH